MHLAVLPGRDVKTDFVFVLEHDAIAADIFNAGFGIARDHEMSRAKIPAAVAFVPARMGNFIRSTSAPV